jgi:hypothetical protein
VLSGGGLSGLKQLHIESARLDCRAGCLGGGVQIVSSGRCLFWAAQDHLRLRSGLAARAAGGVLLARSSDGQILCGCLRGQFGACGDAELGEDVGQVHLDGAGSDEQPPGDRHRSCSVIELLGVVGPLTDPTAHGGPAEDAFDLVLLFRAGHAAADDRLRLLASPVAPAAWMLDHDTDSYYKISAPSWTSSPRAISPGTGSSTTSRCTG